MIYDRYDCHCHGCRIDGCPKHPRHISFLILHQKKYITDHALAGILCWLNCWSPTKQKSSKIRSKSVVDAITEEIKPFVNNMKKARTDLQKAIDDAKARTCRSACSWWKLFWMLINPKIGHAAFWWLLSHTCTSEPIALIIDRTSVQCNKRWIIFNPNPNRNLCYGFRVTWS